MIAFDEQYIVDKYGNQTGVLISIEDYQKIVEALEELESIKVYDDAKMSDDEVISFSQAIHEIENSRQ